MSTVADLLSMVSLRHGGVVRWGTPIPSDHTGIYIVSLAPDPSRNGSLLGSAPIDRDVLTGWLSRTPKLTIDTTPNPSVDALANRLQRYWLPDESVLYIGQTSQPLADRVSQLYSHKLGASSPHRGGHWLKTLSVLDDLFIHYALSNDPEKVEFRLIDSFASRVSPRTRARIGQRDYPFPFANLELHDRMQRKRIRKKHGIGHAAA